ncbi:MAG: hypothetical protein AB7Q42_23780 [Acidimicrobiia bacterium]
MAPVSLGFSTWVRSFPTAARDLLTRRTHSARGGHIGQELRMSDGRTYTAFRRTVKDPDAWSTSSPPAVLQPRFHLGVLGPRRRWARALFRVTCIVTTPLFVGLKGFRSKMWLEDPETGDYAGLYEWDDAELAQSYAEGLARVLRRLSTDGSVSYEIVPGMTVLEYLECARSVHASDVR